MSDLLGNPEDRFSDDETQKICFLEDVIILDFLIACVGEQVGDSGLRDTECVSRLGKMMYFVISS